MRKRDWLRVDLALAAGALGGAGSLIGGSDSVAAAGTRLVAELEGVGAFEDSEGVAQFRDGDDGELRVRLTEVELITPILGAGANLDAFIGPFGSPARFHWVGTFVLRNELVARFRAEADEGDQIPKIREGTQIEIRRGLGPTPSPIVRTGTVILRGTFD